METDGLASAATNESEVEPRSFGHQTTQSTMSIEQILTLAQTGTLEQVIQEGNNMVCQVSSHYTIDTLKSLQILMPVSNTTFLIYVAI